MVYKAIQLGKLIVNPNNDRHGQKDTEQKAVDWLFAEHGKEMLSLAADIAEEGAIFDAPLVKPNRESYVVYDGNRRVTCLKLFAGILDIPEDYKTEITKLAATGEWEPTSSIDCQVVDDQSTIEQIVRRRHNGTDGGRGQLRWDTRAKANHARRLGAKPQYQIAEAVEDFLQENGYPNARLIARSTLYRLINTKKRQQLLGIKLLDDGTLGLVKEKDWVLAVLAKIADDILDKKLTLKHLLNIEGVNQYLATLENEGFLKPEGQDDDHPHQETTQHQTGLNGVTSILEPPKDEKPPSRPKPPRNTLIPQTDYNVRWGNGLGKIESVWGELQYALRFNQHQISIPIVFRTLIELSTDHALNRLNERPRRDNLSNKVRFVASKLAERDVFSQKENSDLHRLLGDVNSPRELEALHRAVHSNTHLPSREDLIALWTGFEKYVVSCLTKF